MVSLIASSSSSLVFIQFRGVMLSLLESPNSEVLFIYLFFNNPSTRLSKSLSFYTSKNLSSSSSFMLLFFDCCIFTLLKIYLRVMIHTLSVNRINFYHYCCIAIDIIWNLLTMKIGLYAIFPCF